MENNVNSVPQVMESVIVDGFGPDVPDKKKDQLLNEGLEDEMTIEGYQQSKVRNVMAWILMIGSVGSLWLFFYWRPDLRLKFTSRRCPLSIADRVLLKDQYDQIHVEVIIHPPYKTCNGVSFHKSKKGRASVDFALDDAIINPPLQEAEMYQNDTYSSELVKPLMHKAMTNAKYFMNKKMKYIWDFQKTNFEKLRGLDENIPCSFYHSTNGYSQSEQSSWRSLYGQNSLVVHVTPVIKLLLTQALDPFYIFQLFSVILWYSDQYYYYASCIILISVLSLATSIYEIRSTQRALKGTLSPSEIVSVYRRDTGEFESVTSDMLIPGDVIEVPRQGIIMQCDAVLINGNCIVNESMLTGESVPVTKTPLLTDGIFNMAEHSRHVLFCGTQVIQTRYYGDMKVKAVVIRTGFATAKGELVRSILFPKPVDFKFTRDAFKFIGILATMALGGMIYTIILKVDIEGEVASEIVIKALDIVTIIIPPALPAAMTVGIVFAQKRLKKVKIFCISPRSINLCGAINIFCFDKTGTLTEEGLDFYCVAPTSDDVFMPEEKSMSSFDRKHPLVVAMATCHSLTLIDNQMAGDPLDIKMFQATDWELEEPGEDDERYDCIVPTVVHPKDPKVNESASGFDLEVLPYQVGILRMFTFSSKLQRMSVITRELSSGATTCYVKGSPEMVTSFCVPSSVPSNFQDILMTYTRQGYRVIGLAYKPLLKLSYVKTQRMERDSVEKDLMFLGLMVFENRLKPQTTPVIKMLKNSNIRNLIVTGDNILTALSVARDCEMIEANDQVILVTALPPSTPSDMPTIDYTLCEEPGKEDVDVFVPSKLDIKQRSHFILNGKSWGNIMKYFPSAIPKLVVRGTVFARFLPEQKQQLIESLQEVGYFVGMCGDGANDCGALKSAHAGISLSEAEASVASPFTSKEQHIECVLDIIREGRAALVTSFGVFKFMCGYSMTQFISVCILYWVGASFTNFTFLYIDLILLTTLGITFCYTGASKHLGPRPPTINLIGVAPILSVTSQLIINFIFQFSIFHFASSQPWFEPYVFNEEQNYQCHEVTVIFFISSFQYITMAVAFTKGAPHRKIIFTNYLFMANLVICTLITLYVILYPFHQLVNLLELQLPPTVVFRAIIVAAALLNFVVSVLFERYFVDDLVEERCLHQISERQKTDKMKYRLVERDISDNPISPTRCTTLTELLQLGDANSSSPSRQTEDDSVKVLPAGDARSFSPDSTASDDIKSFVTPL